MPGGGGSAHPFYPGMPLDLLSLPQVAYLELACYLPTSSVWSFPSTAQGAPSVESHTHTHASLVVQWNRTGGWAGDTSPESLWCPSFSGNLLFSTYTGIQTATFIHTHWSMLTGWPLLGTPCVSLGPHFVLERQRFSADDCNLTVFSLISCSWWLALSQIRLHVSQMDTHQPQGGLHHHGFD